MKRPAEVTEFLRCGGPNCNNACSSQFDKLGVEDCQTWRVHGYVQQLEKRVAHLEALNQQNLSVITMQERTRARLEERISQLDSCIPRWISVEEKLPEHMDDVLVWVGGLVEVGCYDESNECWELYTYVGDGSVTHWMPLPEPTEEDSTC